MLWSTKNRYFFVSYFFLQKLAPALWQIGRIFLQQLFGNQNVFEIYNCECEAT